MKNRVIRLKVNNFKYYHNGVHFVLYELDKYKLLQKGILIVERCLTKAQFLSAINWFNNLNNIGYDNLWLETGELKESNVMIVLAACIANKSKYFEKD